MSCVKPLKAYWRSRNRDAITFDVNHSATRVPFSLPCGRCIGCRLEKARQWGMRCLHEKKMWAENSYVTLTYNDKFLPPGATLCLRDLQLFMKRLRKAREPEKVRFFAGGEYGEENKRPHYHMLLFNCGFRDRVFHAENKRGEPLYVSNELNRFWSVDGESMGFCTIGEVTFDSAVYCAKYALKKVNGDKAFEHYNILDEDGCIVSERVPEFAVMSRRPGIGAPYYEKYGSEVLAHDSVVVNGREVNPPRFYDLRSERLCPEAYDKLKRKRKRLAVLNRADNTEERLRVKEKLMLIAAEKKERTL
ncbi:MAG: replication initiator protein [Microvirus sp.]|nr:MAG: replication initiator protein [Microvirus sp.]